VITDDGKGLVQLHEVNEEVNTLIVISVINPFCPGFQNEDSD